MGNQLTTPQKSLIAVGFVLFFYTIAIIAYFTTRGSETSTSEPTFPAFTPDPTLNPTLPAFTPDPTISPTSGPIDTSIPTMPPAPHLEFDNNSLQGPPGFGSDFYRLGCQAAISEGLFPFSSFNTTGIYHTGVLCNYYTYDTWGFGGDTNQLNCGGNCLTGVKTSCSSDSPPSSPNQPWSDEQCGICATASKDPNCIWTRASDSCYQTITRGDKNVTFVPSYRGMDISQCYYKPQGEFNDTKLCCDPSVA
jgi:hypothetical protein